MSKSLICENDFQAYLFSGKRPAWDGAKQLFISLHSADPGETGDQLSGEIAYTGYARVAIARPGGFTVVGGIASLAQLIAFAERTTSGPTITATHIAIGLNARGPGSILHSYALTSPIRIDQNDAPYIPAGGFTITED